jgi:hypothetical protein
LLDAFQVQIFDVETLRSTAPFPARVGHIGSYRDDHVSSAGVELPAPVVDLEPKSEKRVRNSSNSKKP